MTEVRRRGSDLGQTRHVSLERRCTAAMLSADHGRQSQDRARRTGPGLESYNLVTRLPCVLAVPLLVSHIHMHAYGVRHTHFRPLMHASSHRN